MKEKTINEKIDDFDKSVDWFYSDDFNISEAEQKYKDSIKMAKEIQKDLDELKNRIEILAEDFAK